MPNAPPVITRSTQVSRRVALSIPRGIEMTRLSTVVYRISQAVTGTLSRRLTVTSMPLRYDSPRSPVSMLPSQAPY